MKSWWQPAARISAAGPREIVSARVLANHVRSTCWPSGDQRAAEGPHAPGLGCEEVVHERDLPHAGRGQRRKGVRRGPGLPPADRAAQDRGGGAERAPERAAAGGHEGDHGAPEGVRAPVGVQGQVVEGGERERGHGVGERGAEGLRGNARDVAGGAGAALHHEARERSRRGHVAGPVGGRRAGGGGVVQQPLEDHFPFAPERGVHAGALREDGHRGSRCLGPPCNDHGLGAAGLWGSGAGGVHTLRHPNTPTAQDPVHQTQGGKKIALGGGVAHKPICPTPPPSLVAVPGGEGGQGCPTCRAGGGGGGGDPNVYGSK